MHHFARFGSFCGDRAGGIGEQGRVAQLILREAHLCLSGVDLGLAGPEHLLGFVEFGPRRPATLQELLLPSEGETRLSQHRFGRREIGLRRTQRVLLVLRVQPGDELSRLQHIAYIDRTLDDASVNTKGQADLVLGANLTGERNGLAARDALDGDRPDQPGLGAGGAGLSQPVTITLIRAPATIRDFNIALPFGGAMRCVVGLDARSQDASMSAPPYALIHHLEQTDFHRVRRTRLDLHQGARHRGPTRQLAQRSRSKMMLACHSP